VNERLTNGGFEEGAGPDGLALGWGRFDRGGERVHYTWYDDMWTCVNSEGRHSQLIAIDTLGFSGSVADRYAGIYQTVAVVSGGAYQVTLWGMLRAREGDPEAPTNGYRAEFGYDLNGGNDWRAVTHWTDLGINKVYDRLSPGSFSKFTTNLTASGNRLTLFIRVWKKWPTANREVGLNVDGLSLTGAAPASTTPPSVSIDIPNNLTVGRAANLMLRANSDVGVKSLKLVANDATIGEVTFKTAGPLAFEQAFTWTPANAGAITLKAIVTNSASQSADLSQRILVGANAEFLVNGNFEGGFQGNGVANNWSGFTHGGANTQYTFIDDTWASVVYDGSHSQLIGINSLGFSVGDADRYAGICQKVSGLAVGAQYQLTVRGWIRTQAGDPEMASGYGVQYGLDPTASGDWKVIGNWTVLDFGQPTPMLSPDAVKTTTVMFAARGTDLTLCVRLWKKWQTAQRAVNMNLDGLSLSGFK
jgi:hypothetical protein